MCIRDRLQHGRIMEMENIVEHVRNVMKMLQKITIMDQTTNVQNVVQCKHVNIIGQQIKTVSYTHLEDISALEEEMKKIIKEDLKIERFELPREEAIKMCIRDRY